MANSFWQNRFVDGPVSRVVKWLSLSAIFAFVTYVASVAFLSAFSYDDFPDSLLVKVEALPIIFPLHMITGALALALIPLTYHFRDRPKWHRPLGRITALDVLVSGVTAFPVALVLPVTFWSTAGFSMQAATWLTLLAMGIYHISRKNVAAHKACMLLMAATTTGAIVFRVLLGLWARFGEVQQFETVYAIDAWIAWILPLGLMAFLLRRGTHLVDSAKFY